MAHRVDDPQSLEALLHAWGAPPAVLESLLEANFRTLGSLIFAVPDQPPAAADTFIVSVLGLDPADASALLCAEASCIRRLLALARSLGPAAPSTSTAASAPAAPAALSAKLSAAEIASLRKSFSQSYTSELLGPDSMPSPDFLSALKSAHASGTTLWVPWRHRSTEADALAYQDMRRPRSDRQLLRQFLEAEDEPIGPTATISFSGPAEPTVRKALSIFATALAMLGLVHLLTIKKFNDKFLQSALAIPSDASLRGPTLQEILAADKSVWQAIHALMRDHSWSLSEALNEVAFCRQDIASALQPRPRSHSVPHRGPAPLSDPSDPNLPPSAKRRRRTGGGSAPKMMSDPVSPAAKSKASQLPAAQAFDKSWFKKIDGVEVCMRGALGRCKNPQCKFTHRCPVPLSSGKPCGQQHTALDHAKTKH